MVKTRSQARQRNRSSSSSSSASTTATDAELIKQVVDIVQQMKDPKNTVRQLIQRLKPPSFPEIDMETLAKIGIGSDPGLFLSEDKKGEIEAEGKAGAVTSSLSTDATGQLITFVRNCLMVSQCKPPEFILSHGFSPLSLGLHVE
jgi:hypothetical protein